MKHQLPGPDQKHTIALRKRLKSSPQRDCTPRLEGSKMRVEFLAASEEDLELVRTAFQEYRDSAGIDFDTLKLRIKFSTDVPQIERDLFLMKLESQMNQLRTELTYTRALLTKSEEHQALLQRLLEASRQPASLFQPMALTKSDDNLPEGPALRLVYSYSHKDEELRDELESHIGLLKRDGTILSWHDRKIVSGQEWEHELDRYFACADIILLLISADFINSDYCYHTEMANALERHDRKEAVVIPVHLRKCDLHSAPFGKVQGLPKDRRPITSWENRDEAWHDVVTGIRRAANDFRKRQLSTNTREVQRTKR